MNKADRAWLDGFLGEASCSAIHPLTLLKAAGAGPDLLGAAMQAIAGIGREFAPRASFEKAGSAIPQPGIIESCYKAGFNEACKARGRDSVKVAQSAPAQAASMTPSTPSAPPAAPAPLKDENWVDAAAAQYAKNRRASQSSNSSFFIPVQDPNNPLATIRNRFEAGFRNLGQGLTTITGLSTPESRSMARNTMRDKQQLGVDLGMGESLRTARSYDPTRINPDANTWHEKITGRPLNTQQAYEDAFKSLPAAPTTEVKQLMERNGKVYDSRTGNWNWPSTSSLGGNGLYPYRTYTPPSNYTYTLPQPAAVSAIPTASKPIR